jgi:hypothetical protein
MIFRFGHGFHHHGAFHWLLLVVLIALVVAGGVALIRSSRSRGHHGASHQPDESWPPPSTMVGPALTELRLSYTRGELSWEEFAQRCAKLGYPFAAGPRPDGGPYPPPPPPPTDPPAS